MRHSRNARTAPRRPVDSVAERIVVVSGWDVVAPLGADAAGFEARLFAGRSAIEPFDLALAGNDPARVPVARSAFSEAGVLSPSRLPLDRGTAMALQAARAAAAQAGLDARGCAPERLGVFWGCGMGGAASFDATCRALYGEQRRIRPSAVVTSMPNAPLGEIAIHFKAQAVALGYACACASAAVAIGEAMHAVRSGRVDVAIAGGSEALLTPGIVAAWQAMRVLAPVAGDDASHVCRPFAVDRAGFALGEGAAALVLESAAHAAARGRQASIALSGYGTSCDGLHITQPDPAGQARAMHAALRDAGLAPGDIGHVNAHGTATQAGDAAEAESMRRVFAAHPPPVTASKSLFGHLLGASGAVELAATLCALQRSEAPPTAGVDRVDPAFEIDLVRAAPRLLPALHHAMSNSFAFGGTNAVLVASRLP